MPRHSNLFHTPPLWVYLRGGATKMACHVHKNIPWQIFKLYFELQNYMHMFSACLAIPGGNFDVFYVSKFSQR